MCKKNKDSWGMKGREIWEMERAVDNNLGEEQRQMGKGRGKQDREEKTEGLTEYGGRTGRGRGCEYADVWKKESIHSSSFLYPSLEPSNPPPTYPNNLRCMSLAVTVTTLFSSPPGGHRT